MTSEDGKAVTGEDPPPNEPAADLPPPPGIREYPGDCGVEGSATAISHPVVGSAATTSPPEQVSPASEIRHLEVAGADSKAAESTPGDRVGPPVGGSGPDMRPSPTPGPSDAGRARPGFGEPSRAGSPSPRPAAGPPSAAPGGSRLEIHFPIPNAMVGKRYDAVVPLTIRKASGLPAGVLVDQVTIISRQIDGLEQVGLKAEPAGEMVRIFGEPRESGDHRITISFTVQIRGKTWHTATERVNLTINPDPRSLWKEVDPDPSSPFRRPHTARERLVGDSVLVAASRRGRSHANKGDHRDDEFRLGHLPEQGWYYFAVADGAGSAPLSRRGAELACETTCHEARHHLTTTLDQSFSGLVAEFAQTRADEARKLVRNALYRVLGAVGNNAYRRIVAEAKGLDRPPEDFATTLIFTIAKKFEFGWFVAAIAVGDGGVGVYRRGGGVGVLNRADSGDFAGQTRFLTMGRIWADGEEILGRIRFDIVPDFTAIVAMSDGVSDPKFSSENAFLDAGTWDQFWAGLSDEVTLTKDNARADEELLEWLNFWAVGNHDDRTIVILLP